MKIFDFSKVMFNVSKGKLVAQKGKLVIPTPINSTNCPTVYAMSGYTKKDSDGKEYTILDGSKKIPVCMATENFKVKKGTFEGEKAFLGVRVYLGNGKFDKQELIGSVDYKDGVVNSDGDLVFEYDFPVFEYNTGIFYYLASYNSDSGEGEKFIQNGYFTKMIVNVSGAEPGPVPPEPTDPIEEYQVTGLTVEYSGGSSDSEAYDVSWNPCGEDWFDETCKYEVSVKQGETLIDSVEINYDSEFAQFDPYSYIDDTEYTFDVRVVKGTKKSLPSTKSVIYSDPFHDVTINIDSSELDIPDEGDTNGYTLTWENVYSADKYEVYLDGELYKTTTSSSISISDKDPDSYNLEIKAYNHKNTMISEETTLTLYDPMSSVTLSLDSSDITYNSDDTISISNLTASYGNYSTLPDYIESRLNDESLEIFIDGNLVKTQGFTTIDDIVVSNLDKGDHTISFKLTTTYGGTATSDDISFDVDRCGLIGNSISVTASCDSYENGVTVDVSFNESISESDTLSFTLNGQSVYDFGSSGGSLTIYPDDYETYSIYPDSDNTITVEVSCETGDHSSEPLTGEASVYVPEAPEEEY